MKKIIIFFSIFFSLVSLFSCSSSNYEEKKPDTVFVTFKNYDDSVLYHTEITYGSKVTYKGIEPTRDNDEQYIYIFDGWDKDISNNIFDNIILVAQYKTNYQKYDVEFVNYDGKLLLKTSVEYGKNVTFTGATPKRDSEDKHIEYNFIGWDKDISTYKITGNTTLVAQYEKIEYVFADFYNYDNSHLYTSKIRKGTTPSYHGNNPFKSYSGDDKIYKFIGWDKELDIIDEDTSYYAQFDLLNIYTVTFKNYDNSILQTVKVIQGEDAKYTGSTPYKSSYTSGRYTYFYTFIGWSSSLENVQYSYSVTARFEENVVYEYTDEEKVINFLNMYGSGTYSQVSTGTNTNLGYYNGKFYLAFINNSSLRSELGINFRYGATRADAIYQIYDGNTLMFYASFYIYFSNHQYSSLECTKIYSTQYNTTEQLEMITALVILASREAVNNCVSYLDYQDLPYIF